MNDKALGTLFWCWGDLKDMEGNMFGEGPFTREEFEDSNRDWDEKIGNKDLWVNGKDHEKLAMVIEEGQTGFKIV